MDVCYLNVINEPTMKFNLRMLSHLVPSVIGAALFVSLLASCEEPAATGPTGKDSTATQDSISRWDSIAISQAPLNGQSVLAIRGGTDTMQVLNSTLAFATWDRASKRLLISSAFGFYLPDVEATGNYLLGADTTGRHVALYAGSKYVSVNGFIRITEFDPEFHKLSATFDVTLISRWSKSVDTIHIRGVYRSISLQTNEDIAEAKLTYQGRSYPTPLGVMDTSGLRIQASIVTTIPGCRAVPSDYLYETLMLHLKVMQPGTFALVDGARWSFSHSISVTHPRCPPISGWSTQPRDDESIVVTGFDGPRRKISGHFKLGGAEGTFENLSWYNR